MSRREALAVMATLAAGGTVILPSGIAAAMRQDGGTPEMAPMPATPALGEQPDGTMTWRVQAGHMDMEALIEAQAFFPDEITINAGDHIFFDMHGFHTVTFLGDMEAPDLFVPESDVLGTPVAAGEAIRYVANPIAAFPSGPLVHDGASFLNSGLPDPTLPVVIQFTQPGTFDYLCLPHSAVMRATVVVQEQGAERPHDQAYYDQVSAEHMDALLEKGRALVEEHNAMAAATPAEGSTTWDVAAGVGEEAAQALLFIPDRLEISAGDTVRWTNLGVTEPHTVTFLGDTEPPEEIELEPQQAGPPLLVFNPEVMNPAGGPSYDGASYANSGLLLGEETGLVGGADLPETWELTFDTPGEYPYYCVLHGGPSPEGGTELVGMVGTIVVA